MGVRGLLVAHTEKVGWIRTDTTWDVADNSPNRLYHQLHMDVNQRFADEEPKWDEITKLEEVVPETDQASILVCHFLPYKYVLEVDPDGDTAYSMPHLYCSFDNEIGPFLSQIAYFHYPKYGGLTELESSKRVKLFV